MTKLSREEGAVCWQRLERTNGKGMVSQRTETEHPAAGCLLVDCEAKVITPNMFLAGSITFN